ncbi:MAG: ribose-5-phosphate isomerase RpiA [Gemmatimonadota bacterium]|jgi:ribose 5-phosphate isomerase A|nr:ribose-5-phosphate isomerase RpiA [Gemmatimonadota bacterium]MDP7032716.1 ribose-5-phosphate isomerase RpiA [Gemmatimonadota bacterium]
MTPDALKRAVGYRAAELVEDGMAVGLGTGSTARYLVERLGERVAGGLSLRAVSTSDRTSAQAAEVGVPLTTLEECPVLDLAIDGADEVDPDGQLIKGLGGALYREKRVAVAARQFVVIVDESKLVPRLGEACPVPVETLPDAVPAVSEALRQLGANPVLRPGADGSAWITDNGNPILDAHFAAVENPAGMEAAINALEGVLDNGLFAGLTSRVLVGSPKGVREWIPPLAR